MGGISADDPQAVQKLERKLAGLEKAQETMKAVNAYYRKHKTLDGCPHLSAESIEKMKADMASQWHIEDKPYPTWALSNNSAEIRRVKERIKSLSQQREIGYVGWEFEGGKVETNAEANRLQILFEEKPDAATREELKSNGFRWSPKAEAWQRQLTDNAYRSADYIKAILPFPGKTLGAFTGAYPAAKVGFTGGTRAGADLQGTHKPAQRQPGKPLLFTGIYPAGGRESADRGRAVYRDAREMPRTDGAAQRRRADARRGKGTVCTGADRRAGQGHFFHLSAKARGRNKGLAL